MSAPIRMWVDQPPHADVMRALERLAAHSDVDRVAVMPDVHLAHAVCVGTVTATRSLLLPEAVGGDIGCGMSAIRFDAPSALVASPKPAAAVLAGLYQRVPVIRHALANAPALPRELSELRLSTRALQRAKTREGRVELGTLGRGNHFLELQRDPTHGLWLMVHSGSRALGPAIRAAHTRTPAADGGLHALHADSPAGQRYLADHTWARLYAQHNRARIRLAVTELLWELFRIEPDHASLIECDHNHVQRERHGDGWLWVHRKGALAASEGRPGIIPGSMGSSSYHVLGRGCPEALCSSSHGAGRALSRSEARKRISRSKLLADVEGVWFDHRLTERLREEAPAAYKNIGAVMRAQSELTRIVRRLEPLLVYKGV